MCNRIGKRPRAQGGAVFPAPGAGPTVMIEHVGVTSDGLPLIRINGGEPQALIPSRRFPPIVAAMRRERGMDT